MLGTRYTAQEALTAQIISETSPAGQLLERAMEAGHRLAGKDGLDRTTLTSLKKDTHREACKALNGPVQFFAFFAKL